MFKKTILTTTFAAALAFTSQQADATIVLVETNMGDFEINLFDQTTPKTVANFLSYVNDGSYNNAVFHRSIKDFVVQTGQRYSGNNTMPLVDIPQRAEVENEPKLSNVRGTVAMAKRANLPNSATNHWYVNVVNNSSHLDRDNGGYTVFGVVTGTGLSIIESINNLYVPGGSGPFGQTPLRNYSATDFGNNIAITANNLVVIEKITVINDSPTTAANLNPTPNTLAGQETDSGSSGGGSMGSALLLALAGLAFWRRRKV
ncbi:peptidylprolyl isomerase [Rheinheimera sp. 1928-s]|uniref:peptidylprolyl isomerase n=1 Tax=Rheinheimera sp. 1928-s TaxID=3033803 RepID=UPI002618D368|nr:peptidylprolyl isomerase [Rheinheimera sp. 1928-s]MDF3125285.1 peptidylprolyl isomerase [Rheinheimera sp. 1928-s]